MKRPTAIAVMAALLSPAFSHSIAHADTVNCSISGSFTVISNEVALNNSCRGVATIPSSVTLIGPGAFSGSADLTEVSFASDSRLVAISDSAFFNTSKLTTINIPKTVTTIADNAFYSATALTTITFDPDIELTTFGEAAFRGTTSLTSISLPRSLVTLPSYAFMQSGLSTVTFPFDSELTTIGASAFSGNTSLSTFNVPHSVTSIGAGAFSNSSSLATVNFFREAPTVGASAFSGVASGATANVSYYSSSFTDDGTGHWNGLTINKDTNSRLRCSVSGGALFSGSEIFTADTFYDMNQPCVGDIDIPPFVTKIWEAAFDGLTGLTGVRFWPNSLLTTLGRGVFEGATSLVSAELPPSVTTLGNDIFKSDTSLKRFRFGAGSVLTSIPTAMFATTGLSEIAIPDSVTEIGVIAFRNASNLASVTFGAGSKLATIKNSAFYRNTSLKSISLPKTLTSIEDSAFFEASALASVTLPDDSALTTMGTGVFYYATSLTSFTFPIGVTVVPFATFQGASSLAHVTFKGSVTSFAGQAFLYTSSLVSLRFVGNAPTLNDLWFQTPAAAAKAYVPRGATGYSTEKWSGVQIVEYSSCGTSGSVNYYNNHIIGNDNCAGSLTVLSGTTGIDENAFSGASQLTSISIPSSVSTIGDDAFKNASLLASITFAGNEPELGNSPFSGVASSARVNVGRNAVGFAVDAFGKWAGLIMYRPLKIVTKPTLSGSTVSTRTGRNKLTAASGAWLGGPHLTFTYQWYSCTAPVRTVTQTIPRTCTRISGEKAAKLAVKTAQKGKYIAVSVSGKIDGTSAVTWLTKTSAKVT